jgi:acyl carrier protein
MTEADIRRVIIEQLKQVAPDTAPEQLGPDDEYRLELEIDSFDALTFIVAIHEKLGVDIPEQDYGKITTLRTLVQYIMQHLP